jgi:ABC-type branched-subunit amino acid transport system ATPase component
MSESESSPLLATTDLSVRYGGVVALDQVSMAVRQGHIVGLIGPNGAGKTTLVDALTGFASYTGSVDFAGRRMDGRSAHLRAGYGMSRTFQSGVVFDDLTVAENMLVGERHSAGAIASLWATFTGRGTRLRPETTELIDSLDLGPVLNSRVSDLSQGYRKLVSVAQALACRPQLVLLDEPAAGLDAYESQWLGARLRAVRDGGVTILLVDHDMELVMGVCDEIIVLDFGKVIAVGEPAKVRNDERVVAAYLGGVVAGSGEQP